MSTSDGMKVTMTRKEFEKKLNDVHKGLSERQLISNGNGNENGVFAVEWLLKVAELVLEDRLTFE